MKSYTYRGGDWSEWTDGSVSSSDVSADLSKFDVAAVLPTLQGAPKLFDFKNVDSTNMLIRGVTGGALELSMSVSDHGLNGYLTVNPDGSVKRLNPPT